MESHSMYDCIVFYTDKMYMAYGGFNEWIKYVCVREYLLIRTIQIQCECGHNWIILYKAENCFGYFLIQRALARSAQASVTRVPRIWGQMYR